MTTDEVRYSLKSLKLRYIAMRLFEIMVLGLATYLLTNGLAGLFAPSSTEKILLSIMAGVSVFALRFVHYKLYKLDVGFLIRYLNEKYPSLKQSSDLLLRDESELTSLQQLQKAKTIELFNSIYPEIKLPNHIKQSFVVLIACVIAYFGLSAFATGKLLISNNSGKDIAIKPVHAEAVAPFISSLSIEMTPPSYTKLKSSSPKDFNLEIPEGSRVRWEAQFSSEITNANIIFSGTDSSNFIKQQEFYEIENTFLASGFYQISWTHEGKNYRSDYFKIGITKDEPPKVSVDNLSQFTKLRFTDNLNVDVKSTLADDYGITKAYITATVSKGSGEGIKFREEQISFTTPARITGKQVHAATTLSLKKLGLEPGDELYFYIEAFDNKMPLPNHARTETFFIALQDTATSVTTEDEGLGVDLMPEYFRSQRQIIIDTEKLLKEKKKLIKLQFNTTSNELGYDQKVLRLRYGQFMGEEAESGIAQEAVHHEEEETDPLKQFSHQHDTENEHNLVDQKKNETPGHNHTNELKDANEKEDPSKAFMHNHDDTEEATFFVQSVKAKLKAALTIMWDAELYLRLYEPEKSLPYQYKVLNLLKEISNDSRIYVHRNGFDPPPLKEEKRLTADLSDVKSSTNRYANIPEKKNPAIREALLIIERLLMEDPINLSSANKTIFGNAGNELAQLAIEQPAVYLESLSQIKALRDERMSSENLKSILIELRKTLYTALPPQPASPRRGEVTGSKLDKTFIQSLEKLKHE